MKFFYAFVLVFLMSLNALAEDPIVLKSNLGKGFATVVKVRGIATTGREHLGWRPNVFLNVSAIDGVQVDSIIKIKLSSFTPLIDKTIRKLAEDGAKVEIYGYETVNAEGLPHGAREHVKEVVPRTRKWSLQKIFVVLSIEQAEKTEIGPPSKE